MPNTENARQPPLSPRTVTLPTTPAAPRTNPLEGSSGNPKSSPTSSKKNDGSETTAKLSLPKGPAPSSSATATRRAGSEAPVSKPPDKLARTKSTGSTDAALVEPDPKPVEDKPPVDMETFSQILELDEDDADRTFSKSIVSNYFEQFTSTYTDLETAVAKKDLPKLSALGHFLKGSSAALGVWKVQETCEAIQHVGMCKDEKDMSPISSTVALARLDILYKRTKIEFDEAKLWFEGYFPEGLE